MREAFATPTKTVMPETVKYLAPCPGCGGEAWWTTRQGHTDKANMPSVSTCPTCDPDQQAAAA